jgi:branched-chain amino acid transport system permease protein
MDSAVAVMLLQEGLTQGSVYILIALAIVLVFSVTRILFLPAGDLVAFAALTLAALQQARLPGTVWIALGLGAIAAGLEYRTRSRIDNRARAARAAASMLVPPVLAVGATWAASAWAPLPLPVAIALTLALITSVAPALYRVAFEPLQDASVLVLLVAAVAVHFALTGLGLFFFGPEGVRNEPFSDAFISIGEASVSLQSLFIIGACLAVIVSLRHFFRNTLLGKALRATAVNRHGARVVGIRASLSGRLAITAAVFICALAGVMVSSINTIYYDSGFLIGLKGFVGAVIGGLVSYPLAALGALFVGLLEAYAAFAASAFKEVIVFATLVPVLLWLSSRHDAATENEDSL